MQHSRVAIIKPQQKTADQALEEIEMAIKQTKETGGNMTAVPRPGEASGNSGNQRPGLITMFETSVHTQHGLPRSLLLPLYYRVVGLA